MGGMEQNYNYKKTLTKDYFFGAMRGGNEDEKWKFQTATSESNSNFLAQFEDKLCVPYN